jgi:hypothetical protein
VRDSRVRSLYINNCGVDGLEAVLADAGRVNYTFDLVSLRQRGRLAAIPASTTFSTASVVTTNVLSGDGTSRYTVRDITQLVLPSTYTVVGVELVVLGDLLGVSDLTMDNAALLDLRSTGNTLGQANGVYVFSRLLATRSSELRLTTCVLLSVATRLELVDLSRLTLTSMSGFRLVVDRFVMSATSSATFSGRWGLEAATAISIPAGAVIDGTGGGHGSSQFPSGCTLGPAASGGSGGGIGSPSGATPCGVLEWPTNLGTGGVANSGGGGAGGGAMYIYANASATTLLDLNGTIRVNGNTGGATCSGSGGGGSGGSIAIDASVFSGVGTLQSNGGIGGACVVVAGRWVLCAVLFRL